MNFYARSDETTEWLNYLQPEGLVVGPNVLRDKGLTPIRQTPLDTEEVADALELSSDAKHEDDKFFILRNPWGFMERILGWPEKLVAGSPSGPAVSSELNRIVPEHETLLSPDMAVLWKDAEEDGVPAQMLVAVHPSLDPDARGQFGDGEWEASPHQRLERLLRETGVSVGLLIARNTLRLIHAPRGETAGWISWPLAALGRVEGRPMLAGLKLCLSRNAFFTGALDKRLRPVLKQSREAQNEVSEKLSGQVLGALHELLRGFHRADAERIETLSDTESPHLYEGLLTCLMRLVFLLYAEDRDLLPSSADPHLKTLWEGAYSVKTLYAKLLTDEALNPDTMDERRGGWGQLLAVFRIIHEGHGDWVSRRGGKLFDPDAFPFLEGRSIGSEQSEAKVLPVSDGCILRILHGLMTVEARSISGEKIRERLSYRSLDVESIGSVYETVMGFTALRAKEQMIALKDEKKLPTFIGVESLLAQKAADRQKWLKERAISLSAKQLKAVKEAQDIGELLAALGTAIDERASPGGYVLGAGAPFLQPTEERRRSGSHYTPRSLTEPIVRHALEPAFERIGTNASPEAVLSLKVLDPACGSGAFLVEACRQLGARLEQAWDIHKAEKPTIPKDEDEAIHARRLVAQRCLYGVDRNPMAVDLARLSLWLATLAREHEFSFLDHALKAGDSLVGLTQREIAAANWDASKPGLPLFRGLIKDAVEEALQGRESIRNAPDDVTRAIQESRYKRVEHKVEPARIVGDAVIAAFFSADKARARELDRQMVESWLTGSLPPQWDQLSAKANDFRAAHGWKPFHWEIEFPEVFARNSAGFDAVVGNPPFLGGAKIWAANGAGYPDWIRSIHADSGGKAVDIVAHFFRRAFSLVRKNGTIGFVATKTIAQGDTRTASLAYICVSGGEIYNAIKRMKWPGEASVIVACVHIMKGKIEGKTLNGKPASHINSMLLDASTEYTVRPLAENKGKAFRGADVYGMGFIFSNGNDTDLAGNLDDARRFLSDGKNKEVLLPYIGGEEITTDPIHSYHRYVINFGSRTLAECNAWPDLLGIVEKKVKPKRDKLGGYAVAERRRDRWWQFGTDTPALYRAIAGKTHVIAISQTTAHICFCILPTGFVYSQKTIVITSDNLIEVFAVLQSRVHDLWARAIGATQGDTPVYSPEDCFQTFPFPTDLSQLQALGNIGQTYYDFRAALMIDANEGMTKTYNRLHELGERGEAIQRLRQLHDELDRGVLRAYGWHDLAKEVRPEFLTEDREDDQAYQNRYSWPADQRDDVLSRLLALNAERHAEGDKQGIAPKSSFGSEENAEDDDSETDQSSFKLN